MGEVLRMSVMLLATIVIEYGVLLLLGERRKRVLRASVVINVLTNMALNSCLSLADGGYGALAVGELVVLVVETLWYVWLVRNLKQAFIYSFLCNAISFLIGELAQLLALYALHQLALYTR